MYIYIYGQSGKITRSSNNSQVYQVYVRKSQSKTIIKNNIYS